MVKILGEMESCKTKKILKSFVPNIGLDAINESLLIEQIGEEIFFEHAIGHFFVEIFNDSIDLPVCEDSFDSLIVEIEGNDIELITPIIGKLTIRSVIFKDITYDSSLYIGERCLILPGYVSDSISTRETDFFIKEIRKIQVERDFKGEISMLSLPELVKLAKLRRDD